jgi:polysaccharide biosynthesis protein PslH
MKVLQLCIRFPYPPVDGGTIAMYNMATSLVRNNVQVKMLSFNTKKHFVDISKVPENIISLFKPELIYLDAKVRILPAILNIFSNDSYNISRFEVTSFRKKLATLLENEKYDVVQLESLFVAPYIDTIRKYSRSSNVVLRAHNVEYVIWQRLAASETNPFKKLYLDFLTKRLKQYELSMLNKYDGIIALTEEDASLCKKSGCTIPVEIIPVGIDTNNYKIEDSNGAEDIFHLGSMDWMPNLEGVKWFLQNIFPKVLEKFPSIKVHLAGKGMPDWIYKLESENLRVYGRIENAPEFMQNKKLMIVPLLSGGGMRVKIIEGMAMGRTIISTSIGAEGIKYKSGYNLLIADTPDEFVSQIMKCLTDRSFAAEIGKNARKLAESEYDNSVTGKAVISFYNKLAE